MDDDLASTTTIESVPVCSVIFYTLSQLVKTVYTALPLLPAA